MNTLYLTSAEEPLFDRLQASLKEGWNVEVETLTYADTLQKQEIRLALLRLHDPKLMKVRQDAQNAQTMEEIGSVIQNTDLSGVDEEDLASLMFALGPVTLAKIIQYLLPQVKTDTDLQAVVSLTVVRHSILEAFNSVSR